MAKRQRENRKRPITLSHVLLPILEDKLEEFLGNRLRELRRQQGLSLRALAEKSGLSANTLSLIENGKTSPSVATLQQIAIALNIPITTFFESNVKRDPVIYTKSGERKSNPLQHGRLEELGTGVGNDGLQPYLVHYDPHSDGGGQPITHEGSEFFYCLSGRVIYNIIGQEYLLEPGDSLLFSAKMPHSWVNPGDEPCVMVVVMVSSEEPRRMPPIQYPV